MSWSRKNTSNPYLPPIPLPTSEFDQIGLNLNDGGGFSRLGEGNSCRDGSAGGDLMGISVTLDAGGGIAKGVGGWAKERRSRSSNQGRRWRGRGGWWRTVIVKPFWNVRQSKTDAMGAQGNPRPPILNGENYSLWKLRMRWNIKNIDERAWRIILVGWEKPRVTDADGDTIIKKEIDWIADEIAQSNWNSKCINTLCGYVDSNYYKVIKKYYSAKDAWDAFQRVCEGTQSVDFKSAHFIRVSFFLPTDRRQLSDCGAFMNLTYSYIFLLANLRNLVGSEEEFPLQSHMLAEKENQKRVANQDKGGLVVTKNVTFEEIIALFLHILAHDQENSTITATFVRSGETISKQFHNVLRAVLKIGKLYIKQEISELSQESEERWRWFPLQNPLFIVCVTEELLKIRVCNARIRPDGLRNPTGWGSLSANPVGCQSGRRSDPSDRMSVIVATSRH
ncbi:hypothetical protein PHJA_000832000 [Phtheirospermum japonicum]|uniref:DUF8040 domain-containing protein n=1 Tax=Phtheirospermum japonicum TaxID=374723 RepID=A0A830BL05_9LAMI|nr:hypothetical protein PHJA_000832000 [Phtheirospermum japonicum]